MIDLKKLLDRISFGPALAHWRPRFRVLESGLNIALVGLEIDVLHRDTARLGPLMMSSTFFLYENELDVFRQALELVRALAKHEVDEGFMVDGKRAYDPHANEKKR